MFSVISKIYSASINYRRISLRHNLSRKCRKIVKFVSITHSEPNIWNGPRVATAISREKRKQVLEGNGCLTDSVVGVSWNLRDVTVLWQFNARSDGNLDFVVLLRRRSEGGMNNFVKEDACHQGKGRAGRPNVTGVSPGHLPCHTWGAHRMHLRSL